MSQQPTDPVVNEFNGPTYICKLPLPGGQLYRAPITSVSSVAPYCLSQSGDTLRIASARTPSQVNSLGLAGEICWGMEPAVSVLGVPLVGQMTPYLYVCVATNTWRKVALSWGNLINVSI